LNPPRYETLPPILSTNNQKDKLSQCFQMQDRFGK